MTPAEVARMLGLLKSIESLLSETVTEQRETNKQLRALRRESKSLG